MTLGDDIKHCISSARIGSLGSQRSSLSSSAAAAAAAPPPSLNSNHHDFYHDPLAAAADENREPPENLSGQCMKKTAETSRHESVPTPLTRQPPGHLPGTTDPASESGAGSRSALRISLPEASSGALVGSLGKRSPAAHWRPTQPLGSPFKKPRLLAPGDLSLPTHPQTAQEFETSRQNITSPLFFSNNAKLSMARPPSFATSEVAATIMGETEPAEGVTTLRLPKAVTTASPARSSGTPGSWSSTELSSLSRSPDGWPQSSIIQLFQGIGVVELLEQDDRPTLILDLHEASNFGSGPLSILFANAALRTAPGVLEALQADSLAEADKAELSQFTSWARERGLSGAHTGPSSMVYAGLNWTTSTLRRRFRLLRGNNLSSEITPTSPPPVASKQVQPPFLQDERWSGRWTGRDLPPVRERNDYFGAVEHSHARAHSEPRSRSGSIAETVIPPLDDMLLVPTLTPQYHTTFDWTRIPADDPNLGPHHRFARSIDWASTSLGPIESWPADLRIMSNMIMGSPHPAALYWGPDYVAIYNEAYITLAGKKHPNLMGARYKDAWAEIWDEFEPIFDAAWKEGNATMKHDDGIFITRHGFLEETFFNWGIIPLVGGDGSVVALYNPAFENTRRKISERRMLTLREVGVKTSQARDVKSFWSQVRQGLAYNEYDVPFALIYSVSEDESEGSSMASGNAANPPQIVLEGSIGVPEGHPCATTFIDLRLSDVAFAGHMRDSMSNPTRPTVLSEQEGTLPTELIDGIEWRGFGDPCRTIVIFPVHPTTAGDTVVGFIVLGVNPRRQYDDDYKLFVSLLSRQLATSMASVVLFEEEIKRGQRAARLAALDRQELSMQLHLRTQEAVKSEYRFTRMAEFGPVGLFIADGQGHINYCNEMWYNISGHARSASTLDAWMQCVRDEDQPGVESVWRQLVEEKTAVTHEFRFKGSKQLIEGNSVDIWALMSAYPEKEDTGELKSIFGCITDISQQKWAEDFQKQRRDEAVELKRQQENFIDITSHEMRNPLSAILQCADEISSSLHRYKVEEDLTTQSEEKLNSLINNCVEAAQTITLCASHQKRIVDDILTLSKLDSKLLLVTPVDVQPIMVVQNVLKMFEAELNTHDISGEFRVEQSYRDLEIDWVKLDPSRLRQVLINLMTNAIKFTQGRPTRSILISMGASKQLAEEEGLSYIPSRHPEQADLTDNHDWADGEKINLHLAVTDTGSGLDEDEKRLLFQRFSQTSPRTHVQYGGSGLGLFICRILTELQGGQIGVHSEKGQGSTFAFYIKSRRSDHPQVDLSASVPTPHPTPPRPPANISSQIREEAEGAPQALLDGPMFAPPPPIPQREPANHSNSTNARSLDIMIVEDNIVNQKVLQRQLTRSGNNTLVANHGGEALHELRRSKFWDNNALESEPVWFSQPSSESAGAADQEGTISNRNISVILMDLEMPVMDGMSCTREIRRLEREGVLTRHIPIIAVTAYARPEQIDNAKAAGVDDVISKPFRIPELIPKIEELVTKYGMMSCS